MLNIRAIKLVSYMAAITFHLTLLFTNVGNYFHGGTLVELVALQVVAVLIAAVAIKLLPKVGSIEKIFVVLCTVVPVIFVAWSLISALRR